MNKKHTKHGYFFSIEDWSSWRIGIFQGPKGYRFFASRRSRKEKPRDMANMTVILCRTMTIAYYYCSWIVVKQFIHSSECWTKVPCWKHPSSIEIYIYRFSEKKVPHSICCFTITFLLNMDILGQILIFIHTQLSNTVGYPHSINPLFVG